MFQQEAVWHLHSRPQTVQWRKGQVDSYFSCLNTIFSRSKLVCVCLTLYTSKTTSSLELQDLNWFFPDVALSLFPCYMLCPSVIFFSGLTQSTAAAFGENLVQLSSEDAFLVVIDIIAVNMHCFLMFVLFELCFLCKFFIAKIFFVGNNF